MAVIYVSGATADAVYSDLADLQFLLALPGLDASEARGYFEAAGLAEYFERLRER